MADVAKPAGLRANKSGTWYYRKRCPAHLWRAGLQPVARISLRTKDYATALERLDQARLDIDQQFRMAFGGQSLIVKFAARYERPSDPSLPRLTMGKADALARQFFAERFDQLRRLPDDLSGWTNEEIGDLEAELAREHVVMSLRSETVEHPAASAEREVLSRHAVFAPYASRESEALRENLRRALLQLVAIRQARLAGDYRDEVKDGLFIGSADKSAVIADVGLTIEIAAELYLAERLKGEKNDKTKDRYSAEMRHVVAFFGPTRSIASIKRPDCTELRDVFARLPPNFKNRLVGDLGIRELADLPHDRVLSWATLNKYLTQLSHFLKWATNEDHVAKDYADGLKPLTRKPDQSMAKLPFNDDELRRILLRPLYTGCVNDARGFSITGDKIIRRSRYWAPLIALFSGMRMGEILQLTPTHFRISPKGIPFVVLTKDMDLKNDNAQREIPVHEQLIDIGLLAWVERRRQSGDTLLFPEVPSDKYGSRSSMFSKRFRSDLKHFGLGERRKKVTFHSFRHTFKRALDRADVRSDHKNELCGWVRNMETPDRYGSGLEADVLHEALQRVRYDIDLSHLIPHATLAL